MNEVELRKALVAYGLEERQARVFLALIKRTEANVTELVKDTGIARATVYLDLESLKTEGLISKSRKNGIAHFTPETLNKLTARLHQREEIISSALPFLKELVGSIGNSESTIRIVKGKDGIISLWEELLEAYKNGLSDSYGFTNIGALIKLMPRYFPEWLKQEAKYSTQVRLIAANEPHAQTNVPKSPTMQIKYMPSNYAYPGEMAIYNNKVIFFHVEKDNPHAFVIESKEVAEMQKKMFMLLWDSL